MSSELEKAQQELKEYEEQLDIVQQTLSADPDNAELLALKTELEGAISLFRDAVSELQPTTTSAPKSAPTKTRSPSPPPEKWSKEKHPAYQAGYRKSGAAAAEETAPPPGQQYKVNDQVLAKWVSGDKAFYPARITSITGSAAAPVYYVLFKGYNNSETLRAGDLRPLPSNRKRPHDSMATGTSTANPASTTPGATGAEKAAGPAPPPGASRSAGVISASPHIDQSALSSQRTAGASTAAAGASDRPPKAAKKIKNKRELESGKQKWQEFAAKGKGGKAARKESMFRTGDGVNARVGFTGSGKEMRKHSERTRHVYQEDDEGGWA